MTTQPAKAALRTTRALVAAYLTLSILTLLAVLVLRNRPSIVTDAVWVILAVPGDFPLWLKFEQAVCGVLLLAVVLVVNGKHLRAAFAGR